MFIAKHIAQKEISIPSFLCKKTTRGKEKTNDKAFHENDTFPYDHRSLYWYDLDDIFPDRIGVMYFGKLVEMADADELFRYPLHPYTRSLLSAISEPDPIKEKKRVKIHYDPSIHNYSDENRPSYHEVSPGHMIYCSDSEFEEYKKIRQAVTIQ